MLEEIKIQNKIYEIRGKQVMLDADLSKLYQCKNGTKSINLAVKRHIDRFPERFMFRLTNEEYIELLRFQTETFNIKQDNYSKYLPYAFTEQGVAMLATILKTEVAAKTSIAIMDTFVEMKKYISNSLIENNYYKNISLKVDNKFHDRFIIIDERILYHSGASFKDLGKKCFAINKIINDKWLEDLLKNIKN